MKSVLTVVGGVVLLVFGVILFRGCAKSEGGVGQRVAVLQKEAVKGFDEAAGITPKKLNDVKVQQEQVTEESRLKTEREGMDIDKGNLERTTEAYRVAKYQVKAEKEMCAKGVIAQKAELADHEATLKEMLPLLETKDADILSGKKLITINGNQKTIIEVQRNAERLLQQKGNLEQSVKSGEEESANYDKLYADYESRQAACSDASKVIEQGITEVDREIRKIDVRKRASATTGELADTADLIKSALKRTNDLRATYKAKSDAESEKLQQFGISQNIVQEFRSPKQLADKIRSSIKN